MNRTFIIPAAIALVLHAMLFVGSGKPPKPDATKPKITCALPDLPDKPEEILLKKYVELVEDEKPAVTPEDKEGGGSNEEAPISVLEMPSPGPINPFQFTQDRIMVKPGTGTKIPTNFGGFGKGEGDGPGAGIVSSAFLDNAPVTRRQTPPAYPHAMKVAGVSGTVWVEFVVDENGRVHDVRVTKTTNESFNDATVNAVSSWRFEPGKRKGVPVRFRMTIPIVFNLSD